MDFLKKTAGFSSGIAQINVADTGENQIVIIAGANTQMSVQDIEDAKDRISNAAVVICQLETPPEVAIRTFELSTGVCKSTRNYVFFVTPDYVLLTGFHFKWCSRDD